MAIKPLDIWLRVLGKEQATSDIRSLGQTAQQTGSAVKQGTAQVWSPFIGQLKQAEAEQRKLAAEAQRTAAEQVAAARRASAAVVSAAKDEKDALRQVALAEKEKADAAKQAAKDQQRAYQQAAQAADTAQRNLASQIATPTPRVKSGGASSDIAFIADAQRLQAAQQVADYTQGVAGKLTQGAGDSAMNADEMNRLHRALTFSIGSEAGADAATAWLKEFDRNSPFDFRESAKQLRDILGKGFDVKTGEKLLTDTGDVVARAGGTTENLAAVMRQFSQIQGKGHTTGQDINAIAEGGGIPIGKILQEQLGADRYAKLMSGDKLSADEFFKAFADGAKKYAGGMKEADDSLQGSYSNLQSAQFQLSAAMGQELVPAYNLGTKVITSVTDSLNGLPGPAKAFVAYTGAIVGGLFQAAGSSLEFVATLGQAKLALGILRGTQNAATIAANAQGIATTAVAVESDVLSTSLLTRLAPAMSGLAEFCSVALPGAIAIGIALMFKAAADAANKNLNDSYDGPDAGKSLGPTNTREGATRNADDLERRAKDYDKLIQEQKDQKAISWPINLKTGLTPAQYQEHIDNMEEDKAGLLKRAAALRAKAPSLQSELSMPSAASGSASTTTPGATAGTLTSGASPDAFTGQIRALEDQLTAARAAKDKDRVASLRASLVSLHRQQQDARKAETQANKEQREQERAAKAAEKRGDKLSGYGIDVDKARQSIAFNNQIDDLQMRLDKARDDADAAKVKELTTQIEALKAKQQLSEDLAAAAEAALTDPQKAASMRQIANLYFNDRMRHAGADGERAAQSVENSGGTKKRLSPAEIAQLFRMTNGGQIGGGVTVGVPGVGDFGGIGPRQGGGRRQQEARVGSISENSRGEMVVKFQELVIPGHNLYDSEVD